MATSDEDTELAPASSATTAMVVREGTYGDKVATVEPADYTRYFRPDTSKAAIAWWTGAGVFISCVS